MSKNDVTPQQAFDQFMYAYASQPLDHGIAIAVSGGPDSMALLKCAHVWASQNNIQLHALTVDHGLRKEAAEEAAAVGECCKKLHVPHQILSPDQPIGSTRVQENARQIRYELINGFMQTNSMKCLLLGHHLDDQFETFLMRLSRGSGLKGLNGIRAVSTRGSITLLRPFLPVAKSTLVSYCEQHSIPYVRDPSNGDTSYDRAQLRAITPQLTECGLSAQNVESARQKLEDAESYIQSVLAPLMDKYFSEQTFGIPKTCFLELHPYIQGRLISDILVRIGGGYPPRHKALTDLIIRMKQQDFTGATLHRCQIRQKDDSFMITAEV